MVLDDKWTIIGEKDCITLRFTETRVRKKKNGDEVEYKHSNSYYYGTVYQALCGYMNKALETSQSVEETIDRIKYAEKKISSSLSKTIREVKKLHKEYIKLNK